MILMVCAVFPPEPVVAASLTFDLASALAEVRAVTVLTPKPSRPFGFCFSDYSTDERKFEQIIVPSYTCAKFSFFGRMRESYSFGKHVSRYIRENRNKIDYIYICPWPLFAPYLIARTLRKFSIPAAVHVEDIYPESLSNRIPVLGSLIQRLLLPLDKFILANVTSVITVSDNMKKHLIRTRGISQQKIALIQNWQDESQFIQFHTQKTLAQASTKQVETFTFMYMGNIGPVAGVDFVIHCYAQARIQNSQLIIAGTGTMKEECRKIAESYEDASIFFWNVPAGKVPEIQDMADVMLLPVKRGAAMSSIPSKLVAYLFSKKPVIACVDEKSDTARTIQNARCGWVVPPEENQPLISMMKTVSVLSSRKLKKLGNKGFNYALKNFSKNRNLESLVSLIRTPSIS